jgi:alpha-L-rhamnosidase
MCKLKFSRNILLIAAAITLCVFVNLTYAHAAEGGPLPPTNLRCEYLRNPQGIDVREPRFAWVLGHTERGQKQSAYQVLVASSAEHGAGDKADVWDSGKMASEDSTQVVYKGEPLSSGKTYYWKVRYWDSAGNASPYSALAKFDMGLLARDEWKGQWISGANLLRKEFTLSGKVVRARAYVTALGYYELRLNGEKVESSVLDPGWTTYSVRVLYSTYDVTAQLQSGKNAIGAMLGGGWATLHWPGFSAPYQEPALLLQVNIELAGGKVVSVASDGSWKVAQGPIVSDSVFGGEVYDARREITGWDAPGFDDSAWTAAKTVAGSAGTISAQMMPPIQVVDSMVPVAIGNPRPNVYVYDFGQNFSGWAELHVHGPRGTKIQLRFSELLFADGMINRENIREAKARDIYILKGEGEEVYEPRFTYHGFRYVEVTGFPGTPNLDSLRGRVVHTAVGATGNISASNPLVNQIHKIIRWTDLTTLHSLPTDDDMRNERMGWMGDAQCSAEGQMLNFDVAALYTNFVRDIRDVQGPDGTLTDTVPFRYGNRPADPGWGSAFPLICWYLYEQYGDRRILEENYEALKKYVEFLQTRAPDKVLRYSYYGDWVSLEKTPGELISDFYYYYDALLFSKMAGILGHSTDAASYAELAGQLKDAFNHEFFNPQTGSYATGSQTANALPLFLQMVPKEHFDQVAENLINDILYAHNTHVTTGFIGVRYLMPTLTQIGQAGLAYELATQTTYPSWGYMLANGATTLWELWQNKTGPEMNGHNLHLMGSVDIWFYKTLGGLIADADHPGYEHFRVEPQMVRDLKWASATVDTVRGRVTSSWTRSPGEITLDVEVPVNSTASVSIPQEEEMTEFSIREGDRVVWEQDHFVGGTQGINGAKYDSRRVTFEVGSGHYAFRLTGQ